MLFDIRRTSYGSKASGGCEEGGVEDGYANHPSMLAAGEGKAYTVDGLFDGGTTCQVAVESAREGQGILIRDAEAHAERVGCFLPYQCRRKITQVCLAWGSADTSVERDEEDVAA